MNKNVPMTRQGVRNLDYIKGPSKGIRLAIPPQDDMMCEHPVSAIDYDHHTGISHCRRCSCQFDFDGKPI